jgi:DNA-binding CsgD family transcriptional regulator
MKGMYKRKMAKNPKEQATPLPAGTLSLEYLNMLLPSHPGPDARYAVASPVQWVALDARAAIDGMSTIDSQIAGTPSDAFTGMQDSARGREAPIASDDSLKKRNPAKPSGELFSEREKSCLSWTALGKSSWEIGQILSISENTVVFHIKNAMRKLGVSNRTLAAVKAVRLGIIDPTIESEMPPLSIESFQRR